MLRRITCCVLAAAGLVAAPCASAQMQGFLAGGLGFNTMAADEKFTTPPTPTDETTVGKSNVALQLEGGVRFNTGGPVVWGLGLYVNPLTYKIDESNDNAGFTTKTEVKTLWGVFGELGWKVAPPTVIYGRLSYNQAKLEATLSGGPNGTLSDTFTGVGIGAGFRHSVSGNMYLFTDWHHIMGSEVELKDATLLGANGSVKAKPTITTGLIGLGWTFP